MARRSRRTSQTSKPSRISGLVLRLTAVGLPAGHRLRRLSRVDGHERVRGPPLGHPGAGLRGAARALCGPRACRPRTWSPSSSGSATAKIRACIGPGTYRVGLGPHGARDARLLVRRRHGARAARLDRVRRRAHRGAARLARQPRGDRAPEPAPDRQPVPVARRRPAHRRARRHPAAPDRRAEGRRGPPFRQPFRRRPDRRHARASSSTSRRARFAKARAR